MSPLGPILAATVFSAAAHHAADRAARLARETGAALTLMHVMPASGLLELRSCFGAGSDMEQRLQAEARQHPGQLAGELHATRHVAVRQAHAPGAPLDEIVREAQALDAGLLVVGARGAGFLQRLVLGTTSERLLRRTTRPVLVARHTAHEPYRRVLPSDQGDKGRRDGGSADGAKCALDAAQHLPGAFPGEAAFGGVNVDTDQLYRRQACATATERVRGLAGAIGPKQRRWGTCIVEGDASLRIVGQEQNRNCDLVVLGKHCQPVTEDLRLGKVTKQAGRRQRRRAVVDGQGRREGGGRQ